MKILKLLKHPGNLIITGFIIFAVWMIYFSWKTSQVKFEMAVEGDYYQLEKDYNKKIEAKQNAESLGNAFNFKKDGNKLTLNIPAELSPNLSTGSVEFFCLSDSKFDTRQKLTKNKDGIYVFDRTIVAPGHNYIVKVSFNSYNKNYYKEFNLF